MSPDVCGLASPPLDTTSPIALRLNWPARARHARPRPLAAPEHVVLIAQHPIRHQQAAPVEIVSDLFVVLSSASVLAVILVRVRPVQLVRP